ncbi:MAG: pteridine reductase [Gammaproteobacteria bacterium]|nr:pteridine reductase [Gammaproteobacteria bacterium]MDH5693841.1 pteridine reductase [Gammaproteobacteria bacterium]
MEHSTDSLSKKVALITGAAHRVGAEIARHFHALEMNVVIHYRHSAEAAESLKAELEARRADSVSLVQAALDETDALPQLIEQARAAWGRLDVLVNNASSFYPTPMGQATLEQWQDLMASNLVAPFFLTQSAAPELAKNKGVVINIVDIHADRPLKGYPIYSIAKAGLVMLTKSLARELAPEVRVNAVAPGAILWPEGMEQEAKELVLERTALKRTGSPEDIAKAVVYLVRDAQYTTGQVLAVDGGRTLSN